LASTRTSPALALPAVALALALWYQGFTLLPVCAVLAVLLLGLLVGPGRRHRRWTWPRPDALVISLSLLLVWSAWITLSGPGRLLAQYGLLVCGVFASALLCALLASRQRAWWPLMVPVSLVVLAEALYGGWQFLAGQGPPRGLFVQPNTHAGWLLLFNLPLTALAAWLRRYRRRSWPWVLAGLALLDLNIAASLSRGVALALSAGLLVLGVSLPPGCRRGLLIPVVLVISAYGLVDVLDAGRVAGRMDSGLASVGRLLLDSQEDGSPATGQGDSIRARVLIWRGAWRMWRETPWQGWGLYRFRLIYPRFQSDADQSAGQYAHNELLQLLLEIGLPGLLLVLLSMVLVARRGWKRLHGPGMDEARRCEIAGLLAAMAAISVHSLLSYDFHILPVLLVVGLITGRYLDRVSMEASVSERMTVTGGRPGRRPARILLLAILLALALPAGMAWYMGQARAALARGDLAAAEQALGRAAMLDDTDEIAHARALTYIEALKALPGRDERRPRLFQWAMDSLDAAARMNPELAAVPCARGLLFARAPGLAGRDAYRRAEDAFRQGLRLAPRQYLCRLHYARLLLRLGRKPQARTLLEAGLPAGLPDAAGIIPYVQLLIRLRRDMGQAAAAERLARRLLNLRGHWRNIGAGTRI